MDPTNEDRCRACGRAVLDEVFLVRDDEAIPTSFVFPSIGTGEFAFCNLCFEAKRFADLTGDEIAAVTELFESIHRDG